MSKQHAFPVHVADPGVVITDADLLQGLLSIHALTIKPSQDQTTLRSLASGYSLILASGLRIRMGMSDADYSEFVNGPRVDPKSYELAKHFAQGENCTRAELKELSQAIQDVCEDYFANRTEAAAAEVLDVDLARDYAHERERVAAMFEPCSEDDQS